MIFVDNKKLTHKNILDKIFENKKNITICVAFVKMSGLKLIKKSLASALESDAEISFYVGLDFYITEPEALSYLYNLSTKYQNMRLFLCEGGEKTYHPKLYFSKSNKKASLLIGSANFTNGGLSENCEASIFCEMKIDDLICRELKIFFKKIESQKNTLKATKLNISQYAKKYNLYHKQVDKPQRKANKEISQQFQLDLTKLDKYIKEYLEDENEQDEWRKKNKKYRKAKKILDKMTAVDITSKREFLRYYEQLVGASGRDRLWHSGSLFRLKNNVAQEYKTFLSMLKTIQNIKNCSPKKQFEEGIKFVQKVKGLGVNVLTEILHTYSPNKCSVLNNNPLSSLDYLGFERFKTQPNTFNGEDYEKYNELIKEFARLCEFQNLSQVDHFLNFVYWRYAKNHRP